MSSHPEVKSTAPQTPGKGAGASAPERAAGKAGGRGVLSCLGWFALAAVAAIALLALQPEPAPPSLAGATTFRLPDGRQLAYHVRGNPGTARHAAFWLHGIISSRSEAITTQLDLLDALGPHLILLSASAAEQGRARHSTTTACVTGARYEAISTRLDVLDMLGLYLIGVDRPGYGASTSHPKRSFQTFAEDLGALADGLHVRTFFLVGVSGGGPYALAAAHYLSPRRVLGVMTISSPAPAGLMAPGERAEWDRGVGAASALFASLYRRHPAVAAAARDWALMPLGGRALFWAVLRPLALNAKRTMAPVDVACLDPEHPEYFQTIVPESLRQRSGAPLFEDLALFLGETWSFDVRALAPQLAAATHFWHGSGDLQVPDVSSRALARLMPGARLTIVPGGGHFAYYVCNRTAQHAALRQLLASTAGV